MNTTFFPPFFLEKKKKRNGNILELWRCDVNKLRGELFEELQVPTRHLQMKPLTAWNTDWVIDGSFYLP